MFIAIIGTRCSGVSSIEEFLVSAKGFIRVRFATQGNFDLEKSRSSSDVTTSSENTQSSTTQMITHQAIRHLSFLTMGPPPSPAHNPQPLAFSSPSELLDYVTRNWREHFVTVDLRTRELLEFFCKRPFFMVLSVDAPLLVRYQRSMSTRSISLQDFVKEDDDLVFGPSDTTSIHASNHTSVRELSNFVHIWITNSFATLSGFHTHLEELKLLHPEHLRPGWDPYFMTLADLASQRSNCMKRRVGAILVRDFRIVSTGYNGTPRGLPNCNEGGCFHCNVPKSTAGIRYECVCLHAEENALLEAGRERVGSNSVLYCNTCPCLKCTIKIIQTGVKAVVYNLSYKVDDASASLFKNAGVELRRYDPNEKVHLSAASADHQQFLPLP